MKRVAWLIVVLTGVPTRAFADDPKSTLVDPSASSPVSTPTESTLLSSTLILEATKESKKIKARIHHTWDDWLAGLTFSGPISESASEGTLASFDGLAGGASVEASATWIRWKPTANRDEQTEVCANFAIKQYKCDATKLPASVGKKIAAAQAKVCTKHNATDCKRESLPNDAATREFDEAREEVCRADLAKLRAKPRKASQRVNCSSIGLTKYPAYRQRFNAATDYGTAWLVGLKLKANHKNFKYADAMTFAESKEDHVGASVTASIGTVFEDVVHVSLSYEYQRSFNGGSASDICSPLGTMGNLQCKPLALGAPKKKTGSLFHFELRRFFSKHLAMAFRVHYDVKDEVFGFELPLFFLRNKDGGLAGGITAGFRSDEDVPTLSVFVSETFTLVPGS